MNLFLSFARIGGQEEEQEVEGCMINLDCYCNSTLENNSPKS